jgi:N-acetylmuramoyl-L-alanine amidase
MNIILDFGHGGMLNGKYQTKGKRSPKWSDGTQLFEGVFNRGVGNKVARLLEWDNIDYDILVHEENDISLSERVRRANKIYSKRKDSILISIHANAHQYKYIDKECTIVYNKKNHGVIDRKKLFSTRKLEHTKANGFEVFTSNGSTRSDKYAKILHSCYVSRIKEIKDRGIKEAGFAMVKRTHCPAVLIECGFMTNYDECQFLLNNEYRIAKAIFEGIKQLQEL